MELMFINGIMNSPNFPPRDLWLSGYSISYYHFGYVMTAMLAKLTGIPATMAFNLMLALVFGLAAIGSYGILYNLLSSQTSQVEGDALSGEAISKGQIVNRLFLVLSSCSSPPTPKAFLKSFMRGDCSGGKARTSGRGST
jgi:uncharacterized membrane protein